MNRRDFIKAAMVFGVSAVMMGGKEGWSRTALARQRQDLVLVRGTPPARITRAALEALGGMGRFVRPGDVVVVKPNIGWDRTPAYAANTDPEVVGEIVRLCREAGAKRVKVFDNPVADPRRTYQQSGIAAAATAAGGEVIYMEGRRFKEVRLHGLGIKTWPIYADILEADKVINVPIAKTHGSSVLTLGMKNWMGVAGGWRGRMHMKLDESIVDLALLIRPALIVLDAVRVLVDNGPQGGSLTDVRRLDTVIAGIDQVAVDALGTSLFGMKPSDVGYISIAHQMGLGNMNIQPGQIKRISL
ncbi:MAG: DUF362 domain-containing protein [Syntrophales bacterium]|nr:DUF362 domain-containing protein [Syntrophales bacterium]